MSDKFFPEKRETSIYIVGPSSTGKSTLCNALAKAFDLSNKEWMCISEVARDVMKKTGFTRDDIGSLDMQKAIQDAQLEKEASARAKSLTVLSDRSAVDPIVYAMLTSASEQEAQTRKQEMLLPLKTVLDEYRRAVFILLEPVDSFLEDDGVRSMGDHAGCLELFKNILSELEIRYVQMGPEVMHIEERVRVVVAAFSRQTNAVTPGAL